MSKRLAGTWCVRRFGIPALLFASLLLILWGCSVDGDPAGEWRYFDAFSTDKAASDSYSHSAFVDSPPDISGPGFLIYMLRIPDERSLGFHAGSWVNDLEAALEYEFPLESTSLMIAGGTLEFDVGPLGDWSGSLSVAVSYVGAPGGFSERIADCGHCEYSLQPEGVAEAVRVSFSGAGVTLDNLAVSLDSIQMSGGV